MKSTISSLKRKSLNIPLLENEQNFEVDQLIRR